MYTQKWVLGGVNLCGVKERRVARGWLATYEGLRETKKLTMDEGLRETKPRSAWLLGWVTLRSTHQMNYAPLLESLIAPIYAS
jgi:hypothetical protein